MPVGGNMIANPIEMKRLGDGLLKDLMELEEKTDRMLEEYKKLGETFHDDGYLEIGSYIADIQERISERGEYIVLAAKVLVDASEKIMEALRQQAELVKAQQAMQGGNQ